MKKDIITPDNLAVLEKQDAATLAEWWCSLNRYVCPEGLTINGDIKEDRSGWPIMAWIIDKIGIKECLREWNKDDLPGKSFDEWYGK